MPTLTINDGTFAGGLYAIKNDDNAVLNINGGTFYNTILANGKSMTITDGYFENSKPSQGEYNFYLRKLSEDLNPQNTYISGGTLLLHKIRISRLRAILILKLAVAVLIEN